MLQGSQTFRVSTFPNPCLTAAFFEFVIEYDVYEATPATVPVDILNAFDGRRDLCRNQLP